MGGMNREGKNHIVQKLKMSRGALIHFIHKRKENIKKKRLFDFTPYRRRRQKMSKQVDD